MPRFEQKESYDLGGVIFATSTHYAPFSGTVHGHHVTATPDGKKTLPAGLVVTEIGKNEFRFLPRTVTTGAFSTGSASGGAFGKPPGDNKMYGYQLFVPGDEIWRIQPNGSVTFAGTWVATDQVTLTIGNYSMTFPAGDTVPAEVANNAAAAIRAHAYFKNLVEATVVGNVLHLHSRDVNQLYGLNATTTSSAGTVTRSGANFAAPARIGTIQSINPATAEIILTGNAAISVPVGTRVGSPGGMIVGIYGHAIDMTAAPKDIAATNMGEIYESAMPYLDDEVKRLLPRMTFNSHF